MQPSVLFPGQYDVQPVQFGGRATARYRAQVAALKHRGATTMLAGEEDGAERSRAGGRASPASLVVVRRPPASRPGRERRPPHQRRRRHVPARIGAALSGGLGQREILAAVWTGAEDGQISLCLRQTARSQATCGANVERALFHAAEFASDSGLPRPASPSRS